MRYQALSLQKKQIAKTLALEIKRYRTGSARWVWPN